MSYRTYRVNKEVSINRGLYREDKYNIYIKVDDYKTNPIKGLDTKRDR